MSKITLGGTPCNTIGNLPEIGSLARNFNLTRNDMSSIQLADLKGSKLILNIFPSIDTDTCAASVRTFNEKAAKLENTKIVCISRDLPFAQKRFCGAEGIDNVMTVSDFGKGSFGKEYGLEIVDGPFQYLHARAIVVLDENGVVRHTELVQEVANEPNYDAAISAL
jgi:thiol peroxidase